MVRQRVEGVITLDDQTGKAFGDVESRMSKLGKGFQSGAKSVAKWGTAVTAAAGVAGAAIIKTTAEFESSMANISTIVDTNAESMEDMKKEVLELAKKTPKPIGELTSALYDVRSAGIAAEDAMSVLDSSAKLAVAGLGSTQEATDLVTSAFNNFADQGYDANEISNVLFKTIKNGKTTVQQLAQGFGGVAGIAATAGIDFKELAAATSALTTTGMPASQAYSSLKGAISNIIKPSGAAAEMAESLGLSFDAQALKAQGLKGFLESVKEATGGNVEQMAQLFGSVEGLNAVLTLTGGTAETFGNILNDLGSETDDLAIAVEKQRATFNAQWQELKNKFGAAMIEVGTVVMPLVIEAMNKVTQAVQWLTDKWKALSPEQQKFIVIAAGVTIGIVAVATALSALIAMVNPYAIAIAAFIAGFAALIKIAYDFGEAMGGAIYEVQSAIGGFFSEVGKKAVMFGDAFLEAHVLIWESMKEGWQLTKDFVFSIYENMKTDATLFLTELAELIMSKLASIKEGWKTTWEGFQSVLKTVWEAILKYLQDKINKAIAILNELIEGINKIPGVSVPFIAKINLLGDEKRRQFGGSVNANKPFLVGESGPELFIPPTSGSIVPNDQLGGGGTTINVTITGNSFDSRSRAEEVVDLVAEKLTRKLQLSAVGSF